MCGIFAYIGSSAVRTDEAISVIGHRGPDADGYFNWRPGGVVSKEKYGAMEPGPKVSLAFKRLAIIDLHPHSNQPFSDETGQFHIVFNGEIYNYKELRLELINEGHQFITGSDTEVLLRSYIHWGVDCLSRFNGMWAFVILDLQKKRVFVSRDRFGIKPLFYHQDNKGIYFFSEIKQAFAAGISKKINPGVIREYLESAVLDAGNETFFDGIYRFPASHFAVLSLESEEVDLTIQRFFDLNLDADVNKLPYEEAKKEFLELFKSSIDLRFRSDVPVGTCLSGGLDSSSIVSMAAHMGKHVRAFTVDNQDKTLSEIHYVKKILEKYPGISSSVTFNKESDLNLLSQILHFQDEPFSGMGVIAQWKVMELAKKEGVTVLLDGQGGDELFGGYRKYVFFYLKELIKSGKIALALREASSFLTQTEFNLFEKEGIRRYLNRTGIKNFLTPDLAGTERRHNIGISGAVDFRQKSYEDIYYYSYPQLLRYEDRNSMAFSLESRVPFLDYRLVSFVYSLPASYKIKSGFTKAILRDSLKGILPEEVRIRKSKLGFATPEIHWLYQSGNTFFSDYFGKMENPFLLNSAIREDFNGKRTIDGKSMIRIFLFDQWFCKHFT